MNDKIIDKITKLLALAEHPNTGEAEREAFLAKADELMSKHMIDEALIRLAQKPEERRKPVRVDVVLFDANTVYGQKMKLIAAETARTVGVRMATWTTGKVTLVGFEEDVRWMQLLFTNIHMTFLSKLRPNWNPELSLGENAGALRESGMDWPGVARLAARAGVIDDLPNRDYYEKEYWTAVDRVSAAYRKHCKDTGQEPVSISRHEAYRHTYAEAFTTRVCARLTEMRRARKEASMGTGKELAIRSVEDDVNQAFWDEFPHLDPEAVRKAQEQRDAEHAAWLASLTPAQRLRHEEEVSAQREKDARVSDRYWTQQEKLQEKLYDSTGQRRGRAAAESVNLSTSETVHHANRKELS